MLRRRQVCNVPLQDPVFTSKEASDLIFPEWKNGDFRFEMVMPAVTSNKVNKVSSALSR